MSDIVHLAIIPDGIRDRKQEMGEEASQKLS